ncbi:hypothetical protein [Neobacillus sp.]|uniref:hypothetical protein n=1 Tax=Neobacillus sp. TaxID=2675273 RepID=UPI002897E245|nr:hypothetical protein [Neobacillus sp.]
MIKNKLANILSGIEIGLFDTCKNWGEENYDYYYKYFNEKDFEIRGRSILTFAAMLGNWYKGSADVFRTVQGVIHLPKEQFYFFEDYLSAFLKSASSIKNDFPNLHTYILYYLYNIDKEKPFELVFPQIDHWLFKEMRTQLFFNKKIFPINHIILPPFNNLLKEVGLPTFFSD